MFADDTKSVEVIDRDSTVKDITGYRSLANLGGEMADEVYSRCVRCCILRAQMHEESVE